MSPEGDASLASGWRVLRREWGGLVSSTEWRCPDCWSSYKASTGMPSLPPPPPTSMHRRARPVLARGRRRGHRSLRKSGPRAHDHVVHDGCPLCRARTWLADALTRLSVWIRPRARAIENQAIDWAPPALPEPSLPALPIPVAAIPHDLVVCSQCSSAAAATRLRVLDDGWRLARGRSASGSDLAEWWCADCWNAKKLAAS